MIRYHKYLTRFILILIVRIRVPTVNKSKLKTKTRMIRVSQGSTLRNLRRRRSCNKERQKNRKDLKNSKIMAVYKVNTRQVGSQFIRIRKREAYWHEFKPKSTKNSKTSKPFKLVNRSATPSSPSSSNQWWRLHLVRKVISQLTK